MGCLPWDVMTIQSPTMAQVDQPAGRKAYAADTAGDKEAERKSLLRRKHQQKVQCARTRDSYCGRQIV